MRTNWPQLGPKDGIDPIRSLVIRMRDELTKGLQGQLTFGDNMSAAIIDLPLVHGSESTFSHPSKFRARGFWPLEARDSSGNLVELVDTKFNSLPRDSNGNVIQSKYGVTPSFAVNHTKPFARFRKSANQSHNVSGTNIPVTWDVTQEADPAGVISVTSNPSGPTLTRVTVSEAGKYLVTSTLAFDVNATGSRAGQLSPNGATGAGSRMSMWFSVANAADIIQGTNAHVFKLAAGGYVELFGYQTSGGALNMLGNAVNECSLSIERLWNDTIPSATVTGILVGG